MEPHVHECGCIPPEDRSTCSTSTDSTKFTPLTTAVASAIDKPTQSLWSGRGEVPWPGNTFQIVKKHTNRPIAIAGDQIILENPNVNKPSTHWLCVEKNNYFGFFHPESGRYMGHNGHEHLHAMKKHFQSWEFFKLREHPEGGYQLLSPYYEHTLRVVEVAENGKNICRTDHGTTLWEFIRV